MVVCNARYDGGGGDPTDKPSVEPSAAAQSLTTVMGYVTEAQGATSVTVPGLGAMSRSRSRSRFRFEVARLGLLCIVALLCFACFEKITTPLHHHARLPCSS